MLPGGRARGFAAAIATTLVALSAVGCVSVDPGGDYQRLAAVVRERTGAASVFDPTADAGLASEKIAALLRDGLTSEEAVELALLNSSALQAAFLEIGISRAEVVRSGLLSNPSFGLSLRLPEGGGRSNLTVTFAQQLVDLWQIPIRKRIAEAQLERTLLSAARQAVVVVSQVETRYWRLFALEQVQALALEDVELGNRSEQLAQDRFDAGDAGKLDVNLARAAAFDTQQRLIALRREIRTARADLARVLGLNRWRSEWTLRGNLPEVLPEKLDDQRLLKTALTQRLDARAAVLQIRAAESEVRRQMLDIFPNVTLGVEEERTDRRALPNRRLLADTARSSVRSGRLTAPDIQSRSERNLERSQIIDSLLGPTLDVTLPIWHQNQPQIARARYEAEQRRIELTDLLNAIAQEVEIAVADANSALESVTFYRDRMLPLARENVEAARRAYRAGQQNILALLDAQKTLIDRRRAYLEAQRDYAIAMSDLRRAVGGRISPAAWENQSGGSPDVGPESSATRPTTTRPVNKEPHGDGS